MFKAYSKFAVKFKVARSTDEEDGSDSEVLEDVFPHILSMDRSKYTKRFVHEAAGTWKTDTLQLVRLFEVDFGGVDPFYL